MLNSYCKLYLELMTQLQGFVILVLGQYILFENLLALDTYRDSQSAIGSVCIRSVPGKNFMRPETGTLHAIGRCFTNRKLNNGEE